MVSEAVELGEDYWDNISMIYRGYTYPAELSDSDFIVVITPYLQIALTAAGEYPKKIAQDAIDEILAARQLIFTATLFGNQTGFNKNVRMMITVGGEQITPDYTVVDNKTWDFEGFENSPKYYAVNTYVYLNYSRYRNERLEVTLARSEGDETFNVNMRKHE